jgi:cytochrome c peroxidase
MYNLRGRLPGRGSSAVVWGACVLLGMGLIISTEASAEDAFTPKMPPADQLNTFVKDLTWAKILGRALFWDQQVGSDGMACASCHFAAGADLRLRNQIHPNFNNVRIEGGDKEFGANQAFTGTGDASDPNNGSIPDYLVGLIGDPVNGTPVQASANYKLRPEDFPLHKLREPFNPNGPIEITTNDRISSSGSFDNVFSSVSRVRLKDRCKLNRKSIFHTSRGKPARQVEPRNTPTTVNSVFNPVQFWDGRAKNTFNGFNVFGKSDNKNEPLAGVIEYDPSTFSVMQDPFIVAIQNASLASQAVGPPLSELEMSCSGREFRELGRKMLSEARLPLRLQQIDRDDSLFGRHGPKGNLINFSGFGLRERYDYEELIKKAFKEKWWAAKGRYKYVIESEGSHAKVAPTTWRDEEGYTQMESNFSLFWGLAIMLYEADLISNQSKYDDVLASGCGIDPGVPNPGTGNGLNPIVPPTINPSCIGAGPAQLTAKEADGFQLFNSAAECSRCHAGILFADVMRSAIDPDFDPNLIPPGVVRVQNGFHNLGGRPTWEDVGIGGTDPYGVPLSEIRMAKRYLNGDPAVPAELFEFGVPVPPSPFVAIVVDGMFKTPSLRNTALTPPYFSYGGYATLDQLMEFYFRGGNARNMPFGGNTTGSGGNGDTISDVLAVLDGTGNANAGANNGGIVPINDGRLVLDANCVDEDPVTGVPDETQTCRGNRYARAAIVAFMKTLTDPRVQCDVAPFDHPMLVVRHGHRDNGRDINYVLPAAGKDGYKGRQSYFCIPNSGDLFAEGMQNRVGD